MPFVDVWYSGLHQGPIDTEAPHGNALLGVAFSARGTLSLAGRAHGCASPIASSRWPMRSAMARCACASACSNTPSLEARFTLRRALAARAAQAAHHRASGRALGRGSDRRQRRSHAHRGAGHADRLHAQTSRQSLPAASWTVSPKSLARIHRFRGALGIARTPPTARCPGRSWPKQCGYYDQSHLINEFRRFTGFSPVELARRDRPDSGSVVLR